MDRKFLKYILPLLLLIGLSTSCSQERLDNLSPEKNLLEEVSLFVSEDEAEKLAKEFLENSIEIEDALRAGNATFTLVYVEPKDSIQLRATRTEKQYAEMDKPAYYVFNFGENETAGFVIVSASSITYPILGYSQEGHFIVETETRGATKEGIDASIPFALQGLLNDYSREINHEWQNADKLSTKEFKEITKLRSASLEGGVQWSENSPRAAASVNPLMHDIHWSQSPYYNEYCPYGSPVGCVATATSQIMRYWGYPPRGTGRHVSTIDGRVADFNNVINWNNIPKARLWQRNHDVALLSYNVAVGLNMQFASGGSGTWQSYVPGLLTRHYYYKNTARQIYRDNVGTQRWTQIIKEELSAGRPVQYAGGGAGGAHSFVCDGYARNGYFHINWGWGGTSDGYFLLHGLNPGSLGTGGGTGGGFNYNQDIIIGIEPQNIDPNPNPNPDPDPIPSDGYCQSGARYAKSTYIQRIQIANIDNLTRSGEGGYNYHENQVIKLTEGSSYKIALTPGFIAGAYPEYWRVWIDLDGNKEFSDNELQLEFTTTSEERVEKVIEIPQGITGNSRMRVSMKWGGYPTPCEVFDHGEVEDYPIQISKKNLPQPTDGYCTGKAKYSQSTYIKNVSFANVNHQSDNSMGGYNHYKGDVISVAPGQSYQLQVTPGFLYDAYPEYWRVWIDYDGDNVFSQNELVSQFTTNSSYTTTRSVKIPENARGKSRMRIAMKWGGYPEPCEVFEHGEVEDYDIVFDYNTPTPEPIPTPTPTPTPTPKVYPTSYAKDSKIAFIHTAKIGDMSNITASGEQYGDYSHKIITVSSGNSIEYSLTPGFTTSNNQWGYWRVWIDFNKDRVFSSRELVISRYNYTQISGWMTIPYNVSSGEYRMRVSLKLNGYANSDEIFDYGEVEDYTLKIK